MKRSTYVEKALELFDVPLAPRTAGTYLRDAGFKKKKGKYSNRGFSPSKKEVAIQAWEFIEKTRQAFVWKHDPSKVCSIDFTLTSHRTDAPSTFAMKGAPTPTIDSSIPAHTNAVITVCWADGKNRTPPLGYSTNTEFKDWPSVTKRRKEIVDHRKECCEKADVDISRIKWLERTATRRYFVSECAELVRDFWEYYPVPENCIIFSDGGNAFKEKDTDVLLQLGFANHFVYPSASHMFLSPNDNDAHGVAKAKWRNMVEDFSDDVWGTTCLLGLLDKAISARSKKCFERNMSKIDKDQVLALVKGQWSKKEEYHHECRRAYRIHIGEDARGPQDHIPHELRDRLDGRKHDLVNVF